MTEPDAFALTEEHLADLKRALPIMSSVSLARPLKWCAENPVDVGIETIGSLGIAFNGPWTNGDNKYVFGSVPLRGCLSGWREMDGRLPQPTLPEGFLPILVKFLRAGDRLVVTYNVETPLTYDRIQQPTSRVLCTYLEVHRSVKKAKSGESTIVYRSLVGACALPLRLVVKKDGDEIAGVFDTAIPIQKPLVHTVESSVVTFISR